MKINPDGIVVELYMIAPTLVKPHSIELLNCLELVLDVKMVQKVSKVS